MVLMYLKIGERKMLVCLHHHILAYLGELTTDRWMVRQRDRCAESVTEVHANQQTDKQAEGWTDRVQYFGDVRCE